MRILLVSVAIVVCAVHYVTALGFEGTKHLAIDNIHSNLNSKEMILPFDASRSLSVLENLQNVRLNLESRNHRNDEQRFDNSLRRFQNSFQSLSSLVNNPSVSKGIKENSNEFQPQPFTVLNTPLNLSRYTVKYSLKQNVSNRIPTKGQQTIFGNLQQTSVQHPNVNNQKQAINSRQSFNNQQMLISQQHSFNVQDNSRNTHLSSNDQIRVSQPYTTHNPQSLQNSEEKSTYQRDFVSGQQNPMGSQQIVKGQQNFLSVQQKLNNQQRFFRKPNTVSPIEIQQMVQQQRRLDQEQTHDQKQTGRFNNQLVFQQFSEPQERTQGHLNNAPVTERRSYIPEYQQIQNQADMLLSQITMDALKKSTEPTLFDKEQRQNVPVIVANHQNTAVPGLLTSALNPVSVDQESRTSGTFRQPHLSSGGSVKQHLKTPFVAFDYSHVL